LTQSELQQISINTQKIASLKESYKTLLNQSHTKGQIISDMPTAHNRSDTIGDYVVGKDELRVRLLNLESENDLLIMEARRFINDIPCPVIRIILTERYINCLYYWDIIDGLGCEDIQTEKDIDRVVELVFLHMDGDIRI